jgi:two-component system cell cycle sensor histidine kinase/response regulator CckA
MRHSIRTRLTVAFIGLAIGPLLLVGAVLAWQSYVIQQQQALDMQHEVARRVVAEVTAFFEGLENDLYLVSEVQGLHTLDRDEQYSVLSGLLSHGDVFDELILLDAAGDEQIHLSRVSLPPADLGSWAKDDEFIIASTTGDIYYSPVWFDETTGEPLMTIAFPLFDLRTGSVDGVLIADARIKEIWDIIASIRLSQGQDVYIIDAEGRVVAHRNPSVVLRGTRFDLPDEDGVQCGLAGSRVVLATETVQFGQQEFHVVAEHAASEALALAISTILVTAVLVLATLALSSTLGFLAVRQIVRPIQMVAETAQAISAGDLSQQVEVTGADEVGDLASAFNHMTVQLRQILESQARFVAILEATPDFVGMADADGRVLYINRAGRQMVGFGADEDVTGKSILDLHPPHLAKLVMEEGLPAAAAEGSWTRETALVGHDGCEIPLLQVILAHKTDDGRVAYYSTIARDITERKQAEAQREHLLIQVQEQAQRVQHIVDTVPEGVILLDTDLRILVANPLGKKELVALAGAQVGDVLTRLGGCPIEELLTSPPKGLWHEVTAAHRSFEAIAQPIENGPAPKGWVLVVRDVTQQREVESRLQQQERLSTVGQLAAGMAHDFNNILAVITLYADLSLRASDVSEKVRERLQIIDGQARRASYLIEQILDFSRRAVLERGPLDLVVFVKEQVRLLRRTLPEDIQIDLTHGEDECIIYADATRIQQAIMNLATNARDAMPEGGRLQFALERVAFGEGDKLPLPEMTPGQWIRLTVTDAGTGISPEVQPHVFDPFFTTKEPGKGTGLGLAQVYGIVTQHEGHIDFTTQPDQGTTFAIYLPALVTGPSRATAVESEALSQGQGQTILVVEDDASARKALAESLKTLNYRVLEAANGRQGLDVFDQHAGAIDLVVSDVVMPEMGGRPLLHALRERDPAVRVILLTGHPLDEREFEDLHALGLRGWMLKPLSLEKLAQTVAEALSPTPR